MSINVLAPCDRGRTSCRNENGDLGNCCSGDRCDLDKIKSLPWDPTFGVNDACYHHCDNDKCYSTGKPTLS